VSLRVSGVVSLEKFWLSGVETLVSKGATSLIGFWGQIVERVEIGGSVPIGTSLRAFGTVGPRVPPTRATTAVTESIKLLI